jgi:TM2 domain-containing membrane protein YozV
MKKFKTYAMVSVLALVAFFMIAARSTESTEPQRKEQGVAVQGNPGSITANEMAAPAVADKSSEIAGTATQTIKVPVDHKASLKEKVAAKIVAKMVKKEMRKAEIGKTTGGKSQLVALLLCFFLGALGIHRFYLGYTGLGVLMLLTGGLCGILLLIDFIRICVGDLGPKGGEYGETL